MKATFDPGPLQTQQDFFRKLGFSAARVQAVQQKFGADTDKVLGELVRTQQGPLTTVSALVHRGDPEAGGPQMLVPVPNSIQQSREDNREDKDALRAVVIDGSNVAMSHGNKEVFSCLGIRLAVNFFLDRGHADVTVFVPSWRKEQPRPDVPIADQHILRELEREKILVFTPSRRVAGKRVVCNDDCFIVKHAYESDGVVVSNDMYRDLQGEKPEWKRFIEERLLMYSFVNNKFMPPDDPLGRHGPNLENFLRKFPKTSKKQACPYGKKCTYGVKCKFLHRSKPSNRASADAAQKPEPAHSGPAPVPNLALVEDVARKLTLVQDRKQEQPGNVKPGHRKKSQKKAGQRSDRAPERLHGSQDRLDSGLGSIESQRPEPVWSLHNPTHGAPDRTAPDPFCPPACSCSHGPFWPSGVVPTRYDLPRHASCGPIPISSAYSEPVDSQLSRIQTHLHPPFWSDPSAGRRPEPCSMLGGRSPWETAATDPAQGPEQREGVRKKLLAIFSAPLVDTAMDRFPQVLDPQVLVAEILILQSQNRSLR